MLDLTHDYNELIPPSNPAFPWVPKDWQLLCYYCNQPIRVVQHGAGYRQRGGSGWEHVVPVDAPEEKHKWINGSRWHCDPHFIRPTNEIDDPRCHICGTQTTKHEHICSAGGKPPFNATTLSQKEEELTRRFGWTRESNKVKKERERVTATETVGALTILGVGLGLLAWLTGSLPQRKLDVRS